MSLTCMYYIKLSENYRIFYLLYSQVHCMYANLIWLNMWAYMYDQIVCYITVKIMMYNTWPIIMHATYTYM